MRQRGFAPIILVFVLMLILVGGGAYYFGKSANKSNHLDNVAVSTATPISTSPSVSESKVSWKTYTYEYGNFSVEYPADWKIQVFDPIKINNERSEGVLSLRSDTPERNKPGQKYLCVDFRVGTGPQQLDTVKNGKVLQTTSNGWQLYQVSNPLESSNIATLYLLDDKYTMPILMPPAFSKGNLETKFLKAEASFNCVQGDIDSLNLSYDQQIKDPQFEHAVKVLSSIKIIP